MPLPIGENPVIKRRPFAARRLVLPAVKVLFDTFKRLVYLFVPYIQVLCALLIPVL